MQRSGSLVTAAVALALAAGFAPGAAQEPPDSGAFVTRLGADTIAVERWVRSPEKVEAEVVLRVPRTTFATYLIELNDQGGLSHYDATIWEGRRTAGEPIERRVADSDGKNMAYRIARGDDVQNEVMDVEPMVIPFIDMVHWPFELMLMRAQASGEARLSQPVVSGDRTFDFELEVLGSSQMTVTHPTRGTMTATVDDRGRMLHLDAAETTRKLTVTREPWLDIDAFAERFGALDREGRSFGSLSGRAEALVEIAGATVRIDYGTPAKRGRDIFGALVPYGQVWRTGANLATHLETDADLLFADSLKVPAGTYTLYAVPEEDGGVLIVSTRTGQGGALYPEGEDLGRVSLTRSTLDEAVERFTIELEETPRGGVIRLKWDRTAYSVPFAVAEVH